MKHNKILFFFFLALPACMLMRLLQLFFAVDPATGFFLREYKTAGSLLMGFLFFFCAATVFFCYASHRNPEVPPRKSPILASASFLLAATLAYELATESFAGTVMAWQLVLLSLSGIGATVYFAAYGLCLLGAFRLPALPAVLPPVYFLIKIICTFTSISSLALISDTILLIAAYCVVLLFFLSFGKLQNGIGAERNFKPLLAWGLTSVLLCFTQGLSLLFFLFLSGRAYPHTSIASNLALSALGLFTLVFTLTHFSAKNAAVTSDANS